MNNHLLHTEVQKFINNNLNSDISKILFKGTNFSNVTTQEIVEQIVSKKKCKNKLPTWFETQNIYYPDKLNIEQTSSEITSQYKANLVSGSNLIDITGGFGVDTFAFSKKVKQVFHCEINEQLSKISKHNFQIFNATNIKITQENGLDYLKNYTEKFDWIYIDPSRRNDIKGKVFLLKDCLPNVPENIDFLFENSDNILIKNSPILDISSAINELKFVKEIHIVAIQNEVKELLFILEKNYKNSIQIKTINIQKNNNQLFDFELNKECIPTYNLTKKYLYEPNVSILKSGGFNEVSSQFKIDKLHPNSHLYTSEKLIEFPGRKFEIKHLISFDKKQLKKLIPSGKANITTRNFPQTVAQIRKKTKLKDGGNQYLFFTTDINEKHIVLICDKV
ncbi:MAG: SAM-dependent methyltransferase [Lutibacter sp.]|nr:MAG: SAM-dependent methyltransferase [Lutibacter sp.]